MTENLKDLRSIRDGIETAKVYESAVNARIYSGYGTRASFADSLKGDRLALKAYRRTIQGFSRRIIGKYSK
jgi:hypothetical protein